jgi:hypothetical protein
VLATDNSGSCSGKKRKGCFPIRLRWLKSAPSRSINDPRKQCGAGGARRGLRYSVVLAFARSTASDGNSTLAGAPMIRAIWQSLGVEYLAIAIDGSPDALALDLNCDAVPAAEEGRERNRN